jgi:precorrin-6B methylase 2
MLEQYINKTVPFRYDGRDLRLHLSHGLFSSFDIDSGSKLLLKTIAQRIDQDSIRSLADVGCGVGTLGLSLKKRVPAARAVLQDRDALAVAFSEMNAAENGLEGIEIRGALALEGLASERFDLIVSNFPAKAGAPVLERFITRAPELLTPEGRVALVIVNPLAEAVRNAIRKAAGEVLYAERTANHTVFQYRKAAGTEPDDTMDDTAGPSPDLNGGGTSGPDTAGTEPISAYLRARSGFTLSGKSITLDTVYGLPDFDTPGFQLTIAAETLKGRTPSGQVLFWNPGQGHIPVYLLHGLTERQRSGVSYHIAGNDLLELRTVGHNLASAFPGVPVSAHHLPAFESLRTTHPEHSIEGIIVDLRPIPGVHWHESLMSTVRYLLKQGGWFFLSGKSSDLSAVAKHHSGFSVIGGAKFRGFRNMLLRKL